jgi:hypothetical protein
MSGNNTRKAINRFSTKNSCTRIITYKESTTIRNLKPEWWGSPLVQEEKYQEKPVKREEIIIIIIIILAYLNSTNSTLLSNRKFFIAVCNNIFEICVWKLYAFLKVTPKK